MTKLDWSKRPRPPRDYSGTTPPSDWRGARTKAKWPGRCHECMTLWMKGEIIVRDSYTGRWLCRVCGHL